MEGNSVRLCAIGPSRGYLVLFQFRDHFGEPSSFVLPCGSSAGGSGGGPWPPGDYGLREWGWAGLPHLSWHLGGHLVPSPAKGCFLTV